MTLLLTIIILALIFDYINGFHDAANSIATVVSTKVLTPLQSVAWAAAFNFVAFFIFKDHSVANTIGKTVTASYITLEVIFSGLVAAIVWNLLTWWWGIPSSSSHTLIGGFSGAALANAYFYMDSPILLEVIDFEKISKTILFIFLAPLIGGVISLFITLNTMSRSFIKKTGIIILSTILTLLAFDHFEDKKMKEVTKKIYLSQNPTSDWNEVSSKVEPLLLQIDNLGPEVVSQKVSSIIEIDRKKLEAGLSTSSNRPIEIGIVVCSLIFILGFFFTQYLSKPSSRKSSNLFKRLQLLSSAIFSVGHGGNDAQKVMGIITAAMIAGGQITDFSQMPSWVPLACYLAIGLGTLSGGWKIIKTMGSKITKVSPLEGVCAETSGAITLFMTEQMGIPVSTTHTITGSIIGVGATKRLSAVRWGVTLQLIWAWIITIPISALLAGLVLLICKSF